MEESRRDNYIKCNISRCFLKGTGKVELSLCLTKHHAMKTYWESEGIVSRIRDLGTRWL
jgi:hypothetical protein